MTPAIWLGCGLLTYVLVIALDPQGFSDTDSLTAAAVLVGCLCYGPVLLVVVAMSLAAKHLPAPPPRLARPPRELPKQQPQS